MGAHPADNLVASTWIKGQPILVVRRNAIAEVLHMSWARAPHLRACLQWSADPCSGRIVSPPPTPREVQQRHDLHPVSAGAFRGFSGAPHLQEYSSELIYVLVVKYDKQVNHENPHLLQHSHSPLSPHILTLFGR